MPESRGRARKVRADRPAPGERPARNMTPNPAWYVPVMVALMILGLLWIVAFYLTQGGFPIAAIGNWNLAIGFSLVIAGFLMTTNWR